MRGCGVAVSAAFARRVWTCLAALAVATHHFVLAEERIEYAELDADQAPLDEPLIFPLGHEGLHYHRHARAADDGGEVRPDILRDVDISEDKLKQRLKDSEGMPDAIKEDESRYYESNKVPFDDFWVDLDALNASSASSSPPKVQEHVMLSKSYRRAATISLSFPFPFYGHAVSNITIATGGFLYTGEYVHSWLAATQYIAPLMANFDTSQDASAKIRYADNGTALTVEWTNVQLQGHPNDSSNTTSGANGGQTPAPPTTTTTPPTTLGPFTFQATLNKNGDIVFAYKSVPLVISTITDEEHPVKVGLSDAYIIDRTIFFISRKTIYEYHRVSLKDTEIANRTAIHFKALPTCNRKGSCLSCQDEEGLKLQCKWCSTLKLCSDGVDRNRQLWLKSNCDHHFIDSRAGCGLPVPNPVSERVDNDNEGDEGFPGTESERFPSTSGRNTTHLGLAALAIFLMMLVLLIAWIVYAYFFPHTWSGQLLIKYRPTRWHWLRSEPRYTAASIHM